MRASEVLYGFGARRGGCVAGSSAEGVTAAAASGNSPWLRAIEYTEGNRMTRGASGGSNDEPTYPARALFARWLGAPGGPASFPFSLPSVDRWPVLLEGTTMSMSVKHWQDPVNLVLGLWMVASPWVLKYATETSPTWNAVILGLLIGAIALFALLEVMAWQEWANLALGVWLAISPWLLGFGGLFAATWNAVIAGAVVALLALWALGTDKDIGGWWSHAT